MRVAKQNIAIILASTSKIRQKILRDFGVKFEIVAPEFDEDKGKRNNAHLSIEELALYLAKNKALSISKKNPDALVIGSDQICELEGKAIDKSKDAKEALTQLKMLNGKTHFQNNAVVILKNGEVIFEKISKVRLKMDNFSEDELIHYVNVDKPWGSAGSYKFESFGKHLFAKIKEECYYHILGLNVVDLLKFLQKNKYIELWNS